MIIKSRLLLFILFLSVIFAACKKNPVDGLFVAKLYSCSSNQNSKTPYICFDSLITESRCPISAIVQCLGSGYALIKVSFHENGNTHILNMLTPAVNPLLGGVNDTIINGYHLVLKSLEPYPSTSNVPISNDDRKATIEITK